VFSFPHWEKNKINGEIPVNVNTNLILWAYNCGNKPKLSGNVQAPHIFTICEQFREAGNTASSLSGDVPSGAGGGSSET